MSTITEHHPLPARAKDGRVRTRAVHPRPRDWTGYRSEPLPVMGPANRAPGAPIMGAGSLDLDHYLMGGPDATSSR